MTKRRQRIQAGVMVWLAVTLGTATATHSQTVYRCSGNQYSQSPCPDGRPVDIRDMRSTQQQAESLDVTRRSEGAAQELQQQREREQEAGRVRGTARISDRPKQPGALPSTSRQARQSVAPPTSPAAGRRKTVARSGHPDEWFTATDGNGTQRETRRQPKQRQRAGG